MPITDAHVGRTYPATAPYLVGREKIAEFADALGDHNPAYRGEDPVAPPTFAAVLAARAWGLLFDDPELGLALRRTIHVDQRFTFARALRAGDEIVTTLSIEKVRLRGPAAVISLNARFETTAGEHVGDAASTLMHTSQEEAS